MVAPPEYSDLTPLGLAVLRGDLDAVGVLLNDNPSIANDVCSVVLQAFPLHIAAAEGRAHIARTLVSYGADVNAKGDRGRTPLHVAAESGRRSTCVVLLDSGADLAMRDIEGCTALHLAIMSKYPGSSSIKKLLISRGAPVDVYAAACMLLEARLKQLIEQDAECVRNATRSQTILSDACLVVSGIANQQGQGYWIDEFEKHRELLRLLIAHGAVSGPALCFLSADAEQPELAILLLSLGADPNGPSETGELPLEVARRAGNAVVVRALIEHGAL
jgi:ankyrin repeat protein